MKLLSCPRVYSEMAIDLSPIESNPCKEEDFCFFFIKRCIISWPKNFSLQVLCSLLQNVVKSSPISVKTVAVSQSISTYWLPINPALRSPAWPNLKSKQNKVSVAINLWANKFKWFSSDLWCWCPSTVQHLSVN